MIPKVNEVYPYYDDGKIRPSRRDDVKIIEIISFDDIDNETLEIWKAEVESCDFLFNGKTDYFIKAHLIKDNKDVVFVRTIDNRWFSLGWFGGVIDVDNSLTNGIIVSDFI